MKISFEMDPELIQEANKFTLASIKVYKILCGTSRLQAMSPWLYFIPGCTVCFSKRMFSMHPVFISITCFVPGCRYCRSVPLYHHVSCSRLSVLPFSSVVPSLVLFQAVGIAVEFCSHIVHAFILSTESTRVLKAKDALINTGSSVSRRV
jgi:hypothetical protein